MNDQNQTKATDASFGFLFARVNGGCYHALECANLASLVNGQRPTKSQKWCVVGGVPVLVGEYLDGTPTKSTTTITVEIGDAEKLLKYVDTGCTIEMMYSLNCEDDPDADPIYREYWSNVELQGESINTPTNRNLTTAGTVTVDIPVSYFRTTRLFDSGVDCSQYINADETPAAGLEPVDIVTCQKILCGGVTACGTTRPQDGCSGHYVGFNLPDGTIQITTINTIKPGNYEDSPIYEVTYDIVTGDYGPLIGMSCVNDKLKLFVGGIDPDTEGGLLEKCGDTYVLTESQLNDPIVGNAIASDGCHILYGQNAVAEAQADLLVQVSSDDPTFPQQTAIASDGESWITVGEGNGIDLGVSYQLSTSFGLGSGYLDLPIVTPTSYGLAAAISGTKAWIVWTDGSLTYVHQTFDGGANWVLSDGPYSFVPTTVQIESVVDGNIVYLELNGNIKVNLNSGCKCDWKDACMGHPFAVCDKDPMNVLSYYKPAGAYYDYVSAPNTDPVILAVLDNDLAPDGCTLDETSVIIIEDNTDPSVGVVVNIDGTITFTPTDPLVVGVQEVVYQVTDSCGNVYTATAVVDFFI